MDINLEFETVLKNLRKKYTLLSEALNYTKEMHTCYKNRDDVSFGMYLDMRGKIFKSVDLAASNIEGILKKIPKEDSEELKNLLDIGYLPDFEQLDDVEQNIYTINKSVVKLLQKIADVNDILK